MSDAGLSMPSPPWPGPAPAASQILGPAPPSINRGPGTTVHAQIEDWLAELSKLEQDLTTLAGFSEQLRRHGMVAGARVLSATERPAGPVAVAALEVAEGATLYEVRRVRLGDGRPIALEHSLFPAAVFPGMLGCRLDGSLYELLEAKYGQRPCRAKESLEPVSAGVREAEALEVKEGAALMLVERTAYTDEGTPVEFARDLFRGDRTRLVMWTSELPARL